MPKQQRPLHANAPALARFLAAGHRLVREKPGDPWSWVRPGADPVPVEGSGHVHATIVENLRDHGLIEENSCAVKRPGLPDLRVVIAEATHQCMRQYAKPL